MALAQLVQAGCWLMHAWLVQAGCALAQCSLHCDIMQAHMDYHGDLGRLSALFFLLIHNRFICICCFGFANILHGSLSIYIDLLVFMYLKSFCMASYERALVTLTTHAFQYVNMRVCPRWFHFKPLHKSVETQCCRGMEFMFETTMHNVTRLLRQI